MAFGSPIKWGRSNQPKAKFWKPLLAFLLFSLVITVLNNSVFQRYKADIKADKQGELSGIAELKTRQITNWITDRKGDAQAITGDLLFLTEVDRWLLRGHPPDEVKLILGGRLASLQQAYGAYGYTSISLFDDKAALRLSSSANEMPTRGMEKMRLLESMRTGQIILSEVHLEKIGAEERLEIELIAPLVLDKNGGTRTLGAVLFRIDPYRFLFPLIQLWPTHSPSAENLLVSRDGDEVVFLNELRHIKNTALKMRLPLSRHELPAAMAAMGQEGLVEGIDYRGVPVVGALSKVPGTSWAMVSKIDKAEIYAPINGLANWMIVLMLGLIGVGGGISIFWREKEKKLFEDALEHQALGKHLDYLTKYANDIILLLDSSGKIVDFNDRALAAYGYSGEEMSVLNIVDLLAIKYSLAHTERVEEINRAGGALVFESIHARKNGENFPVESSVRVVEIAGEKLYQVILRDITDRKRAASELARQKEFMHQVIDSNPNLIFVKDAGGRFLLANEAMAKSYGLTTEGIIGKCNSDLIHDPEQAAAYDSANREVLESRRERIALETGILSDGEKHWFQTIRKPLVQDDGSVSVLTIAMDITELKVVEEEQQRLNRALRLLNACNAALVHAKDESQLIDICMLLVDMGGYLMAWVGYAENDPEKSVRPVMQYGFEEGYLDRAGISWAADTERGLGPIGMAIRTGITQVNQNFRDNPLLQPWRDAALERGYQSSIALPLCNASKVFGVLAIYSAQVQAFNPEEISLLQELASNLAYGIVTQRVRIERALAMEKLRQSEEHFRFLTENATDMVFLMSVPDLRFTYVSPASTRMFGYTPEEFYTTPSLVRTLVHPDSKTYLAEQTNLLLAGSPPLCNEYSVIHKSGETRWLYQRNMPIFSKSGDGTLLAIQGVVTDITERKQAQVRFENERIRLRTLVQTIPDLVWLKDPDGVYLSCNRQFERLFGASEENIIGKTDHDFVDAAVADHFRQKDMEAMAAGIPCINEECATYPDNGPRVLLETIRTPVLDENGKLIGVMGIARDITARKQAEQELRFKNTLLTTEHESSIDGILVVDKNSKIISFNRRFVEIWDVPDDVTKAGSDRSALKSMLDKLCDPEQFIEKVQYLYEHPDTTSHDEIRLLDGRVVDRYTTPMNDTEGMHHGRMWYFRDITERKQAEERESQLRRILDSTLDMIFIFRPDSLHFEYINQGAINSIGYSHEELHSMTPPDIQPLLPEPEFRKLISPLITGPMRVLRFETTHKRKNNTDLPVEVQLQLVHEQGRESLFIAIVRDITERKRAEKELLGQKAFMWQVIDSDPNQIFVKDELGNFLLANQSLAASYGLTPAEIVGRGHAEISHSPKEVAKYLDTDRSVIEKGHEISFIEPHTQPNGQLRWFLTIKKPLTMPDGKSSVLGIAVDITQQKLSEIQLAESYRKLQRLSLHLETVRADERARIALNLHDEMGATLVAIKMGVAWLASKLPTESTQVTDEIARIIELVTGGIHTMRQIVTQLKPNLLDDIGLAAAITDYVKKFRQHTGIECILELPEEEFSINEDQAITIFRIVQEALNNVAKHSQASKVSINFKERDASLLMVIKDNGIGFDPSINKEQSFGLLGIKERALMIGGKARITSTPGKGTRVTISIPHTPSHSDYVDVHDA